MIEKIREMVDGSDESDDEITLDDVDGCLGALEAIEGRDDE